MYYFEIRRHLRQKVRNFQKSPTGKAVTQLPMAKLALIAFGFLSVWHMVGLKIAEYKDPNFMLKAAESIKLDAKQDEMEEQNEQERKRRRAVAQVNMDHIWSRPMISVAKTQYPLDCD